MFPTFPPPSPPRAKKGATNRTEIGAVITELQHVFETDTGELSSTVAVFLAITRSVAMRLWVYTGGNHPPEFG